MIDERHEESAALYALDLLEGEERAAFETELARNAELRALTEQLRETGAQLAHLAPAAAPSPFLRDRVLASAEARTTRARRWPGMVAWAAAACLGLGTGVVGWQALQLKRESETQRGIAGRARLDAETIARALDAERELMRRTAESLQATRKELEQLRVTLRDERTQSGEIIAALRRQASVAELKIQSLASLVGDTPQARAIAVWNPLTQEGVLTVANLPALEANKDYQLWLLQPGSDVPVDAGVFRVDAATGEARVAFKPSRQVPAVDKFAVSLERKGGVPKPEGPLVLLTK